METAPRNPPSPEEVGAFALSLIQAFLRTGYYLPEHPESRRAKTGLYERFADLARTLGEVAFILRDDGGQPVVTIEGVHAKPLRLKDIMIRGMADTYNPRFVHFLERKELISLSLLAAMTEEEFSQFIDVMSEPSLSVMQERKARDSFVDALQQHGIFHISFVFHEDFLATRPGVPWRTTLALSRLRKDLRMVPVFQRLNEQDLGVVRRRIMTDILRPLSEHLLIYAFLMNLDLSATAEFSEQDAEDRVLESLDDSRILPVACLFIADASGQDVRFRNLVPPAKVPRMVGKLLERLRRSGSDEARAMIEEMFHAGLVALKDLPREIHERVMTAQFAKNFLADRARYLEHLEKQGDAARYLTGARLLARIVPLIFEEGHYAEAEAIAATLARHAGESLPRAAGAKQALEAIAEGPAPAMAGSVFLCLPKEERTVVGEFLSHIGPRAAPVLLGIIRTSDDIWQRKQAAELLVRIGREAAIALIQEIDEGSLAGEAAVTAIRVLGEVSDATLRRPTARVIEKKLADADPAIRREALAVIVRHDPRGRFEIFQTLAADTDPKVRRLALRGLGLCGDARALAALAAALPPVDHRLTPELTETAAGVAEALGALAGDLPDTRGPAVEILTRMAAPLLPQTGLKGLISRRPTAAPALLNALVDALAHAGGDAAQETLRRLAASRDAGTAERAARAGRR